jgi:hypothetical protein
MYPIKLQISSNLRASPAVRGRGPCKKVSHIQLSYLLFSNSTHKTKTEIANRWESSYSNQPRPIKLCSQLIVGVGLYCTFHHPQKTVKKCWATTILLSQTDMFCLFFVQFYFAGSPTEHWCQVELLLRRLFTVELL